MAPSVLRLPYGYTSIRPSQGCMQPTYQPGAKQLQILLPKIPTYCHLDSSPTCIRSHHIKISVKGANIFTTSPTPTLSHIVLDFLMIDCFFIYFVTIKCSTFSLYSFVILFMMEKLYPQKLFNLCIFTSVNYFISPFCKLLPSVVLFVCLNDLVVRES